MKYKKDFFYGLLIFTLVILGGYFFDLSAMLSARQELIEEIQKEEQALMEMERDIKKQQIMQRVSASKTWLKKILDIDIHPQGIRLITEKVRICGLSLRQMTSLGVHQIQAEEVDRVQMKMIGSFKAFSRWLQLLRQEKGILITDFSFAAQKEGEVLFVVDLWLWPEDAILHEQSITKKVVDYEPFCVNSNQLQSSHSQSLQEINVHQMKILGVIDDQGEKAALSELNDGELVKIKKGMKLGAIFAEVIAIDDDGIDVLLANKERLRLSRVGAE